MRCCGALAVAVRQRSSHGCLPLDGGVVAVCQEGKEHFRPHGSEGLLASTERGARFPPPECGGVVEDRETACSGTGEQVSLSLSLSLSFCFSRSPFPSLHTYPQLSPMFPGGGVDHQLKERLGGQHLKYLRLPRLRPLSCSLMNPVQRPKSRTLSLPCGYLPGILTLLPPGSTTQTALPGATSLATGSALVSCSTPCLARKMLPLSTPCLARPCSHDPCPVSPSELLPHEPCPASEVQDPVPALWSPPRPPDPVPALWPPPSPPDPVPALWLLPSHPDSAPSWIHHPNRQTPLPSWSHFSGHWLRPAPMIHALSRQAMIHALSRHSMPQGPHHQAPY
ncbi:uncharacterized protein LOC127631608 [Xyrauchen texanus]|uniref:uncharacterized protein LOC127631608 n=1 Tax=Xyrauchen texanus TaxID=154827 RepID=UPI0022425092|nr:uncharacterized protein LOC127631608 [Xyrauchen texanus]